MSAPGSAPEGSSRSLPRQLTPLGPQQHSRSGVGAGGLTFSSLERARE